MKAAANMICPRCGRFQPRAPTCSGCGVVVEKALRADADAVTAAVEPVPSGLGARAMAWLQRRFPFVFGYLDARERMAHSFDSVVPLAPFRKALTVLGVCGLVLVVASGVSTSRAPRELVYATDGPEVRCGPGAGPCEAVYRLTLGNLGEEPLRDAVVVWRYGRFASHVDLGRELPGDLDRLVASRRTGEAHRAAVAIMEELAPGGRPPGFEDVDAADGSARSWQLYDVKLDQLRDEAFRRASLEESTAPPDETVDFLVGRVLPTQSVELRLTLSFDGEAEVLPWSGVLARIDLPEGEVHEGNPHLGMLGRFLMIIGL